MDQSTTDKLLSQVTRDYNVIAKHFSHTRMDQWYEVSYLIEQYVDPGQVVLDLGCGNGRVADLVEEIKAQYVGMDVSKELIAIARQLRPNHQFYVGDMRQTGFPDASFDHVLLIASFHHVPGMHYRLDVLNEVYRIVKMGGYVIMTNWNLHQWKFRPQRWKANGEKFLKRHTRDCNDLVIPWKDQKGHVVAERYYHGYTKKELSALARDSGFTVIDQYYETHGMHVPRYKGQNLVTILQKY